MKRRAIVVAAVLFVSGCGGDSTPADLGADAGHVPEAGVDAGDAGADLGPDAPGCTDADADGHGAQSCGGDDCDDADANRYPGNAELCDAIDQDCDPASLGPDADGDGVPAVACCNPQATGAPLCGTDCNDASHDISPTAPESCNGVDDDCDGMTDEGVTTSYFEDCDGDGHGRGTAMDLCAAPSSPPPDCPTQVWVTSGGDCNDCRSDIRPGAPEPCDGIDNNCDGTVDGATHCFPSFDPSGSYSLAAPIHPMCGTGAVDFSFDRLDFSFTGTTLNVIGGGIYCTMTAGPVARSSRTVDVSCTLPGGCDETYSLTGTFAADGSFMGTFTAAFDDHGDGFSCLGCSSMSYPLTGSALSCT